MDIDFTGRQMNVTQDLRQYIQEHLKKFERLLPGNTKLHVILAREKHRRIAEITVKLRDQTLVGVMETADSRSAIKGALDKLERQAVRWCERRRTKKRRPKPTATIVLNILGGAPVDSEERAILRTERLPVKPLTVLEAVEALKSVTSGIIVFRNTETEHVNVIYLRPDGDVGLVEPEP